ncbi:MAG: 3-isopropylmalate dehydratase small subunit [Gemmatirosa sp.]|nr:3-isopropylmalate dehydratase small subunit [Gemmatirosa sp.]
MTDTTWTFTSPYVVLPRENVDTDQIIPARFLTTTSRVGLGPFAFNDWRWLPDGAPNPDFPIGPDGVGGARVLVAGHNFGCGSSREHAVWALAGIGVRAVVSSTFADIFRGNALGNGLLPIEVSPDVLARLMAAQGPDARVGIDLASSTLTLPDGERVTFPIPPFARHCLLHGIDELQFVLGESDAIAAYEAAHPRTIDTTLAAQEAA